MFDFSRLVPVETPRGWLLRDPVTGLDLCGVTESGVPRWSDWAAPSAHLSEAGALDERARLVGGDFSSLE